MTDSQVARTLKVAISDDGSIANADLGAEHWCFVVQRSRPHGTVWGLSLCLYTNSLGTWDGMASQNQPRPRIDRPPSVPKDVAIAVFDVVGWPVSPPTAPRQSEPERAHQHRDSERPSDHQLISE